MSNVISFGDVVAFHIGGGWGQADPTEGEPDPAYVIRGTDIPAARYGEVANIPRRFHKSGALTKRALQHGDIVFESSGGSPGQPVGRALLITRSLLARFDDPVICASFCKVIRPDPSVVDPAFLYNCLLNSYHNGTLSEYQVQSTGITNFQWKTFLAQHELSLPSAEMQRSVSFVLRAFDDLIENNRRRVDVLEEMARAIYREWFVNFRYPGHEDATFVDSPLGPIPEGWGVGAIEKLVALGKTTVDPTTIEPTTPAVGLEHIPRRQITLDAWSSAADLGSRKSVFKAGDLLFGKIRPYFHKVSVAPVDGICSTDALVLRPVDGHWGQAVMAIASDDFVAHATQTANGTKMPRADWKVIKSYPVTIPPPGIAGRFTELAHDTLGHAQVLMMQGRELAAIRDLLLPKLVTGQLDVSSLDLDALVEAGTA